MKTLRMLSGMAAIVVALAASVATAQPVSTTFTYQGKLMNAGAPASGTYDFQFKLFDGATGGNQSGSTNCDDGIAVPDGLVTLTLGFGDVFSSGTERYLEVGVRADTTPGNCASGVYSTLSPRQDVTGAPLAIGLRLPFTGVAGSSTDLVTLSNTGVGGAISATVAFPTHAIDGTAGGGLAGVGVYGQNTTLATYGYVGGQYGVRGYNPTSYGIVGESCRQRQCRRAPRIKPSASTGLALGGYFETSSPGGVGVQGDAIADGPGGGTGVLGTSSLDGGLGAEGESNSATGNGIGVYGRSNSVTGTGVFGAVFNSSGVNFGVFGETLSANGYAGYFRGRGYFSDFVGLGVEQPTVPRSCVSRRDRTSALSGGGNDVVGQVGSANLVMDNNEIQARSNGGAASLYINANGGNVGIGTNNAQGFQLAVNGSAAKPGGGAWSTLSDVRLKKNVRPLTGSLDRLLELHGVTFEYIDPTSINELTGTRTGMIAQEVERVFPDWVDRGPDGMRRVTFRGFEALTVEALRDLKAREDARGAALTADADRRLAEKNAQITELRSRLDRLEAVVSKLTAAQTPLASSSH